MGKKKNESSESEVTAIAEFDTFLSVSEMAGWDKMGNRPVSAPIIGIYADKPFRKIVGFMHRLLGDFEECIIIHDNNEEMEKDFEYLGHFLTEYNIELDEASGSLSVMRKEEQDAREQDETIDDTPAVRVQPE